MGDSKIQGAKGKEVAEVCRQPARQITVMSKFLCGKVGDYANHDCPEEVSSFVNVQVPNFFDSYVCNVTSGASHMILTCTGTPKPGFASKIWIDAVNAYQASVNQTLVANGKRIEEQSIPANAEWMLFCNGSDRCMKKHGLMK